jgi:hypothetical protein
MPAPRAKFDVMIEESAVYGFGRKRFTFVLGVSWLATDGTPVLAFRERRLGRLDDVRGRGLGGRRRILACRSKLFLQLQDEGLKSLDSRALSVELLLRPPAIRAVSFGFGPHKASYYTDQESRILHCERLRNPI